MAFNFATFQNHLHTVNPSYSKWKSSSFTDLERYLQGIGAGLGPANLQQVQALYGAIPYAKQQKYLQASNYLKANMAGLADAIPAQPKMHYREFKVMFTPHAGNHQYPMRFYHVHELTWSSSNGIPRACQR